MRRDMNAGRGSPSRGSRRHVLWSWPNPPTPRLFASVILEYISSVTRSSLASAADLPSKSLFETRASSGVAAAAKSRGRAGSPQVRVSRSAAGGPVPRITARRAGLAGEGPNSCHLRPEADAPPSRACPWRKVLRALRLEMRRSVSPLRGAAEGEVLCCRWRLGVDARPAIWSGWRMGFWTPSLVVLRRLRALRDGVSTARCGGPLVRTILPFTSDLSNPRRSVAVVYQLAVRRRRGSCLRVTACRRCHGFRRRARHHSRPSAGVGRAPARLSIKPPLESARAPPDP